MKMIFKTIASIATLTMLAACSSNNVLRVGDNEYVIEQGRKLQITKAEYERLSSGEIKATLIKGAEGRQDGKKALVIDNEEMNVLMQDRRLFFAELDKTQDSEVVAVLFRKGLVKDSLGYIAESNGWKGIEWSVDFDLINKEPFAVVGSDFQTVLVEAIKEFPITVVFDEKNKVLKFN